MTKVFQKISLYLLLLSYCLLRAAKTCASYEKRQQHLKITFGFILSVPVQIQSVKFQRKCLRIKLVS